MGYRTTRRQLNTKQRYQAVERFNERTPIGSQIIYRKDDGTVVHTKTRSRAELLGGHTPVVWIDGIAGCVALGRVSYQ